MPRVALTSEQIVAAAVQKEAEDIEWQLHKAKISKTAVADYIGLTRAAVSHQFKTKRLMPEVSAASRILLEKVAE